MAVHLGVSFLKHQPFGHLVARIDHEPLGNFESAYAKAHGLAGGVLAAF